MSKTKTRTPLSEVVLLYTTREEDPLTFSYEVECTTFKALKLTLNFEGSENFAVDGKSEGDMTMTADVHPFTRVPVGKICLISDDRRASLKMGCEWVMQEPSTDDTDEYMRNYNHNMAKLLKDTATLKFPSALDDPSNKKVSQICKNYGKKFIDLEFPPTDASLYKATVGKGASAEAAGSGMQHRAVEWKRPSEFMTGEVKVFEGIDASDIRQGALGDCWFLCAIAALTEFPELVTDLFPKESRDVNEAGVYRVKFCKNGIWQTVRVDDFFPCFPGGGPMYSRSNGDELWVLLLEKAFAKLCGSYEAVKSGWAYEAMMDMTGAPCRTFRLDDSEVRPTIDNGELWKRIVYYDQMNYIMSASTPGEDIYTETGKRPGKDNTTGLVAGHAYTLIAAKESSKGIKLMKLRNPWGSMEWTGDWSDSSPLWTEEMQNEIEVLTKEDDGTFWMCFEDVVKHFYSINVCLVRHEKYCKEPWKVQRRSFCFEYDPDDATPDSHRIQVPIYVVNVAKAGTFCCSVHQQDTRCAGAKQYIDMGVSIMKANSVYGTFELVKGTGNSVERQNETGEFELQPGKYVVVPTTTGIKLRESLEKDAVHHYGTAAAAAGGTGVVELIKPVEGSNGEVEFSDAVRSAFYELFTRLDQDGDGYLNKTELDSYMMRTEGSPIQDTAFHWLLHNFESKEAPGLSRTGFLKSQLFVFKHSGCDEGKLRNEFKILGFNADLKYDSGRNAVLVMHGTSDFTVTAAPFDHEAYEEAVELPAIAHGDCSEFEDGKIQMYKFRSGYGGMSFVVRNNHTAPLVFVLDCSESTNVQTHRDSLNYQETIPPNEAKVLHHLCPKVVGGGAWSWAYSASYMWDE